MLQNTFVDAEIVENSIKVGKRARVIEILSKYKAKSVVAPNLRDQKIPILNIGQHSERKGQITQKTEDKAAAKSCIDAQYRFDQATERAFIRSLGQVQRK